jgi:hypothetical protein
MSSSADGGLSTIATINRYDARGLQGNCVLIPSLVTRICTRKVVHSLHGGPTAHFWGVN